MNEVLRITISVVAALVTLCVLSILTNVVLEWEGRLWIYLNAFLAFEAGFYLNAFLKKKYPPQNQDQEDKERE